MSRAQPNSWKNGNYTAIFKEKHKLHEMLEWLEIVVIFLATNLK